MGSNDKEESSGLPTELIEDFIGVVVKAFTAVAGVGALLYATGFLVVNINLLSLGAYEVGLLRERFVTAGIIFLATFTFIFFTTIVVSFWIDDGNYAHYYNRFLVNFVGTMIVMLPVIYLVIQSIFLDSAAVGLVKFDTSTFNSLLTYLTRWAVVVLAILFLSLIVDWLIHYFRPGYSALLFHMADWTIHQFRSADSAPRSHIDRTIKRLRSTRSARLTQMVDWTIQRLRSAGSALRSLIDACLERLFGPADPVEAADKPPSSKILSIMGFVIKLFLGLFVVIPFLLNISAAWDPSSKKIIEDNYYLVYGLLAIIVSLTLIVLDLVNAVIGHSRIAASFKPPPKDGKKRKVLRFGTIIGTMMIMIVAALFLSLISSGLRLENVQETLDHLGVAYEAAGTPGDFQLEAGFEEFYKPLAPRIVAWSLIYGFFLYFLRYAFIPNKTEGDGAANSVTKRATQIISTFFERKWPIPYFLLIFFLSLYFFSRDIYAAYPPALGGGLPIVVQFLAKDEHHLRLKQLGIFETDDTLTLSPKVDLIAQTSSHYIVLVFDAELNRRTAVSFPKEYVDGVKFSPEEYYLDEQYVAGRRTEDGRALLNEGAYEKAIAEFKEALNLTEKSHVQALIGLGDSYVKQAEVDPGGCEAQDCHIDAICHYLEVINKPNAASDKAPTAHSSEKADARYQLARALAIFDGKLSDVEIKSLVTENEEICKEKFETEFNNKITEDMVDIRNNLSEAVNLEVSPALYRDKAIKDEAFNDHQYWTNPEFYNVLFTTMKNAATKYGDEGELAREAEEMQRAINWYYRALSLVQGFDGSIQAREEEARLRYLLAGVYLDLWDQGRIADGFGWTCDDSGTESTDCSLEKLISSEVDGSIEPILEECDQAETDLQDCTIEKMIINEFNTAVTRDANYLSGISR
jgi:tetratricopeptide (TPR) repeat protein